MGLIAGLCLFQLFYISAQRVERTFEPLFGKTVLAEGRIGLPVTHYKDSISFILKDIAINGQKMGGKAKCYQKRYASSSQAIVSGAVVKFLSEFKPVTTRHNPGGFDKREYLFYKGVYAVCNVKGKIALLEPAGLIQTGREDIRQVFETSMGARSSGIISAMILGETGGLTPEIRDTFMKTGLSHMLAVSGTHMGIVTLICFFFFKTLLFAMPEPWILRLGGIIMPSRLASLLTLPFIVVYFLISGMRPAACRALIMIVMFLCTYLLGREKDIWRNLSIAAALILVFNPFAVFDVSFQLSFTSVAMIIISTGLYITPRESGGLAASLGVKALNVLITSSVIITGTAPLVIYHFNRISMLGPLTNLIFMPLIGLIIIPAALLTGVLSLIFPIPVQISGLLDLTVEKFYILLELISRMGHGVASFPAPPVIILFLIYISGFLLWRAVSKNTLKKKLIPYIIVAVLLPGILYGLIPVHRGLRVSFIDVGAGDSILVEFPGGETMLIDGGGKSRTFDMGRTVVAPYLWNRNIRKLDYVVMTHPHLDHFGGLIYIMENFETGRLLHNGEISDLLTFQMFQERAQNISSLVISSDTDPIKIGEVMLEVINPPPYNNLLLEDTNYNSVVLRISYQSQSILLTADIENEAMARIAKSGRNIKSDIVKLPHHGARHSSEDEFIRKTGALIGVISVGENQFGHPNPATVDKFRKTAKNIYRTDRDGAVIIEINKKDIRVTSFMGLKLKAIFPDSPWEEYENYLRLWKLHTVI